MKIGSKQRGVATVRLNHWRLILILICVGVLGLELLPRSTSCSVGTVNGKPTKSYPTDREVCLLSPRLCLKRSILSETKSKA